MDKPKYTCANCESEKEPYFSRSEPMGFFCRDCGQSSDQLAVIHPNAIRTQQEEQNDHECELAAWELLKEAKATAEHWIQKAKEAEQAAADLKAEVEDWKKEYTAERALADRLAGVFEFYYSEDDKIHIAGIKSIHATMEALAAWKEARSEV